MNCFVFQSLKAHVPLIKFRKGQLPAREVKDSFGETYQEIKSTSEQGKVRSQSYKIILVLKSLKFVDGALPQFRSDYCIVTI